MQLRRRITSGCFKSLYHPAFCVIRDIKLCTLSIKSGLIRTVTVFLVTNINEHLYVAPSNSKFISANRVGVSPVGKSLPEINLGTFFSGVEVDTSLFSSAANFDCGFPASDLSAASILERFQFLPAFPQASPLTILKQRVSKTKNEIPLNRWY